MRKYYGNLKTGVVGVLATGVLTLGLPGCNNETATPVNTEAQEKARLEQKLADEAKAAAAEAKRVQDGYKADLAALVKPYQGTVAKGDDMWKLAEKYAPDNKPVTRELVDEMCQIHYKIYLELESDILFNTRYSSDFHKRVMVDGKDVNCNNLEVGMPYDFSDLDPDKARLEGLIK